MKKNLILAAVLVVVAVGTASAQLSVHAGYAGPRWTYKGSEQMHGANAGLAWDITLNPAGNLMVRPGVEYSFATKSKDRALEDGSYETLKKVTSTEQALSLPVHVKWAFVDSDDVRLYVFAGPKLGYGLSFNEKYQFTEAMTAGTYIERDHYSAKVKSDIDNPAIISSYEEGGLNFGRLDVAVSGGVGVQYRRLYLEFVYDFGLLNRLKNTPEGVDGTIRRNQMGASVGFQF